jgi:uncharacterized protein YegJ (DUF2314 family)
MNEDPIKWCEGDDPEMVAAIAKAQATLPDFLAELDREAHRIIPALDAAVAKVFFSHPGRPGAGEHMFVDQLRRDGENIRGVLASDSMFVPGLKAGRQVAFPLTRISDWFYVVRGRGQGGYTIDLIASRMSKQEYLAASKSPPFSWFAWRQQKT